MDPDVEPIAKRSAEQDEAGGTAPGEPEGRRSQLDGASGGYGTQSGTGSSGGSGEGEPQANDEGTSGERAESGGATGESPTDWLRGESTGR